MREWDTRRILLLINQFCDGGRRVLVTSRSGAPDVARSRVIAGENAKEGGGLQERGARHARFCACGILSGLSVPLCLLWCVSFPHQFDAALSGFSATGDGCYLLADQGC